MAAKTIDLSTYSEGDLVDLRRSIEKEGLRRLKTLENDVGRLKGMLGLVVGGGHETGNGRKASGRKGTGGGKRSRATPEEVEARKAAIVKALKGTSRGNGLSASEVAEKAGLSALSNFSVVLSGMRDGDKSIKMEGKKSQARWHV